MAVKFSDVVTAVTESAWWSRLTAFYDSESVPWQSWSLRNPFLALSRFVPKALGEGSDLNVAVARGMFLEVGQGDPLTLFSRSQYGLERRDAQFTIGRLLLTAVAGAPSYGFSLGQLRAGTPGPTTSSKIFVNTEADSLLPGQSTLLEFTAEGAGESYNLPNSVNLDLKTSLAGVTVSNPPSGPALTVGTGNSALRFWGKFGGVRVQIISTGTGMPLSVFGNLNVGVNMVTIQLATNGFGIVSSTAEQVRSAVKAAMASPPGSLTGQLLLECKLGIGSDGGGIAQGTAPVVLPFLSSWIASPGTSVETDGSLSTRDRLRWPTLGGGAGAMTPVAPLGTTEAMEFWARAIPDGYSFSPVSHVAVHSNLDIDTGMVSGGVGSIILAGPAGAISAADVTAVEGNFYKPRKFAFSTVLKVRSATNLVIPLVGTVNIRISSGRTVGQVAAEIATALAEYPTDIAMTVYPQNVGAHMAAADFVGIRDIVLTSPSTPVIAGLSQIPTFDPSGLTYALV